jgi:hypothetical protein
LFEVTFTWLEGRVHTLNQANLICASTSISFSSWRPHFDSRSPHTPERLDFPVWVQIVNLCQVLREDTFLITIGDQIDQVISINNSDAYRAKLFGPRIRLLIRNTTSLPHTVVIPILDGKGVVEDTLEYTGLPNQRGRCHSLDHQVRNCPKREGQVRRRVVSNKLKDPTQQTNTQPPPKASVTTPQPPVDHTRTDQLHFTETASANPSTQQEAQILNQQTPPPPQHSGKR